MRIEKVALYSGFVFFAAFLVFVFALFSGEISSPDFWWHLKTGEYIYAEKSLPHNDPFSFTTPSDDTGSGQLVTFILTQYWLAQTFFSLIYSLVGFQGIIFLRATILTLLIVLLYRGIRREGCSLYCSLGILLPALVVFYFGYTAERPQLFSFLCSFLLIYLIEGFRQKETQQISGLMSLLPLPVIMLLWANLHGGFIMGIVIIAGYSIAGTATYLLRKPGQALPLRSLKLFLITGALSIALSFVNPNGYKAFSIMLMREQGAYTMMVTETVSPFRQIGLGFYSPELMMYFLLLFLVIVLFFINRRKLDLSDLTIFLILAAISLYYSRANPFFAPFAALMVARYGMKTAQLSFFSNTLVRCSHRQFFPSKSSFLHIVLSLFLTSFLLYSVYKGEMFDGLIRPGLFNRTHDVTADKYPEGAAAFIKNARLSGNMFNPYDWGGYLLWSLHPQNKVFIDGRGLNEGAALDGIKIMEAFDSRQGIPEWRVLLDNYRITFMVAYSVDSFSGRLLPFIPALLHDQEWHLVYMDALSLIFLRDSPENSTLIKKFGMPKEWLWSEVVSEARLKSGGFWSRGILSNFYATTGDAYFARKYYREANLEYMKALSVNPENSAVRKRLELLRDYGY